MDQLPNEVIINIFKYCKVTPLLLVSRKFHDIIINSPKLMFKFPLLLSEKNVRESSELILKSSRKWQVILLKFNYKVNEPCLEIFRKIGNGVKQMEIVRSIIKAAVFVKILELLPNLANCAIYTTYLQMKEEIKADSQFPPMKKLRKLSFRNSDDLFLRFLQNSVLHTVNISFAQQYALPTIMNFLDKQRSIKVIENLSVSHVDLRLLTFVVDDLLDLVELHLEVDKLASLTTSNLLLCNKRVKFLSLYGNPANIAGLNCILSVFKDIRALEFEMNLTLQPENMNHLRRTAPLLEKLLISNCTFPNFNELYGFNHLKYFEVTESYSVEDWEIFAQRNSTIETLILKDELTTDAHFNFFINALPCLQHLEFFYTTDLLTPDILNLITFENMSKNIKVIKILQRNERSLKLRLNEQHVKNLDKIHGLQLIMT
ncbi:unnamed protein product [Diamesa serratosioi]